VTSSVRDGPRPRPGHNVGGGRQPVRHPRPRNTFRKQQTPCRRPATEIAGDVSSVLRHQPRFSMPSPAPAGRVSRHGANQRRPAAGCQSQTGYPYMRPHPARQHQVRGGQRDKGRADQAGLGGGRVSLCNDQDKSLVPATSPSLSLLRATSPGSISVAAPARIRHSKANPVLDWPDLHSHVQVDSMAPLLPWYWVP